MTRKNDNRWKAAAISAIWISMAVVIVHVGFWSLSMPIFGWLATLAIVEA